MKKYIVIVVLVFGLAFAAQMMTSVKDVFNADWSTWSMCINAGIFAVLAWFITYATDLKKELSELRAAQNDLIKHMSNE
jgi:uncharacterized membrane protein